MRTSPARLLILIAIFIVVAVETRTVLAFFGIGVTVQQSLAFATLGVVALVLWAVWPVPDGSSDP